MFSTTIELLSWDCIKVNRQELRLSSNCTAAAKQTQISSVRFVVRNICLLAHTHHNMAIRRMEFYGEYKAGVSYRTINALLRPRVVVLSLVAKEYVEKNLLCTFRNEMAALQRNM